MTDELSPEEAWCYATAARIQAFVFWISAHAEDQRDIDHEQLYSDLLEFMSASYEEMTEDLRYVASEINLHAVHIEREVQAFRDELADGLDSTPDN